jgi:hypothetical protein
MKKERLSFCLASPDGGKKEYLLEWKKATKHYVGSVWRKHPGRNAATLLRTHVIGSIAMAHGKQSVTVSMLFLLLFEIDL